MTVIAVILLVALSFPLKNSLISESQKRQSTIQKATKIENKTAFDYAVKTEQGNILTSGKIKTTKPVKFPEMDKSYLQVEKIREVYTMHTRTVTDSKGHSHTETYWTWDYMGSSYKKSKYVTFKGRKYPAKLFDYSEYDHNVSANKILKSRWQSGLTGYYYYVSGDVRYYYSVVPISLSGCMLANAGKHGFKPFNEDQISVHNKRINGFIKDNETRVKRTTRIFYAVYFGLMIAVIAGIWLI